jgi:hypothetical protein
LSGRGIDAKAAHAAARSLALRSAFAARVCKRIGPRPARANASFVASSWRAESPPYWRNCAAMLLKNIPHGPADMM